VAHYIINCEGVYPVAYIKKTHREHLERDSWINGDIITFPVPEPILYDLDPKRPGKPKVLYDATPIPLMHITLLEAFKAAGVDNLQTYDAVLRDTENGVEYKDYKAFNVVGKIAAADMGDSTMMGTSDSTMIDADFDGLVLDEAKCAGKLLFRLAENITAIIVDERVKVEVEERGIKGIFFYASGRWSG
jgi:hypothetical protein